MSTERELWQEACDAAVAAYQGVPRARGYDFLREAAQRELEWRQKMVALLTPPDPEPEPEPEPEPDPEPIPDPVPLLPYLDPRALDVPWGQTSTTLEPWRGWGGVTPATTLRDGIGINYRRHIDRDHAADLARYAAAGIRRIRYEIARPYFDGRAFRPVEQAEMTTVLRAARANGIRPLMLLNDDGRSPWTDVTGWLGYVRAIGQAVRAAGHPAWDAELWNETWTPPADRGGPTSGVMRTWAQATVDLLRVEFPECTPIWGFSNYSFFYAPIDELPAGFSGQSYHAYFFKTRQPEGALTWVQTESLIRYLEPAARAAHPGFDHYLTEHGINPPELGVTDPTAKQRLSVVATLRSLVAFLHRGITGLYLFADKAGDDYALDPIALPALSRLGAAVRDAGPGPPADVRIETDAAAGLAVFPFQMAPGRLGVAVYRMTRDLTVPAQETVARIRLTGISGAVAAAPDLLTGASVAWWVVARTQDSVTFDVAVSDSPRWVEVSVINA